MNKEQKFLFEKYLSLLGLKKSSPDFNFLCSIVKSHLMKVPFENISKLLLKKRGYNYIPSLEEYLDGINKYNFGGTCYANNYYLNLLLNFLGFDAKLCGADMKEPDVHLISVVTIDKKEFIVDCGYAAPFFYPFPRNLKDGFVFDFGDEKYIVKSKDINGHTRVEQHFNGMLQHWYTAKPHARKIEEFQKVIEDSYNDDSTFMNAIRITKFIKNGSLVLKNLYLSETIDNKTSTKKLERKELSKIIEEKFGIPESSAIDALSQLKELKDIYD